MNNIQRVTLRDMDTNVVDTGSGPVVLLVHGFPLDHSMWQHQLTGLDDSFRLIAPDLRGFGGSSGATDKLTMEQFADDLAELLDALRISEPVTFCGLSMGGYIAWQFAQRHAARLARLIVCDTRAAADTPDGARGRHELAERVLTEGSTMVADAMIPKLFAEQTRREQPALVAATQRIMSNTAPQAIAGALRGMAERPDVTSRLPRIEVPALVVCGEHDAIIPVQEMRTIAESLPHGRFVEIPEAGHMAPLENPTPVNAAIREFLNEK